MRKISLIALISVISLSLIFAAGVNIIQDPSFRHLYYGGVDYLGARYLQSVRELTDQHIELLDYLEGKDVTAIDDLRNPGEIITETEETIDGFTGATVRSSKVMSAMRDALNRGKYDR